MLQTLPPFPNTGPSWRHWGQMNILNETNWHWKVSEHSLCLQLLWLLLSSSTHRSTLLAWPQQEKSLVTMHASTWVLGKEKLALPTEPTEESGVQWHVPKETCKSGLKFRVQFSRNERGSESQKGRLKFTRDLKRCFLSLLSIGRVHTQKWKVTGE